MMDPATGLVRNPQVPAPDKRIPIERVVADAPPTPATVVMVDVVVLSGDLSLFEAIRHSVGERNPVWRARSAEESVDLLLTGRCGVLLIDMAAVSTRPTTLIEQLVDQFPDVVIIVAGRREDESVLAGLISDGLVYRFMHKPLSPKRGGMFLNAAMRCHLQRREGRSTAPLLPLVRELKSRVDPRKWLFVGGGLILFVAALAAVLVARYATPPQPDATAAARAMQPATPLADPVLSRARAAFAAGRYDAPPGRNALDLFSAVLLTRPDDVEARQGLERTMARLVADAERLAASGDAAEARRIARRVLDVDAGNGGAHAVLASLSPRPPAPLPVATPSVEPAAPMDVDAVTAPPADPRRLAAVPVTRFATQPVAVPPPPPPAPVAAAVVRPDPLTPRVVGPGVLPTSPTGNTRPKAARYVGAPVRSAPATARYVQQTPRIAGSATPTPSPPPAPVVPMVAQRDLEPVATPDPTYPPAAFRGRIEGWVELDFTVNERGTTGDIAVVDAEPRGVFDAAATAAVARWTYRPRVVNGQPVAQRASVMLRFNVED